MYTLLFFIFKKNTNPDLVHVLEHIIADYLYFNKNIENLYCRSIKNCFYIIAEKNLTKQATLILKKITNPTKIEYTTAKKQIILEKNFSFGKTESDLELSTIGRRAYLKNLDYAFFLEKIKSTLKGYAIIYPKTTIEKNFSLKDITTYKPQKLKKTGKQNILIWNMASKQPIQNILNSYLNFDFLLKDYKQDIIVEYDFIGGTYYITTTKNVYKVADKIQKQIQNTNTKNLFSLSKLQFYAETLDVPIYKTLTKYIMKLSKQPYKLSCREFSNAIKKFSVNKFNWVIIE